MIHCVGVDFSYPGGPNVLDGVALELPPAGRVTLLGTSGSGKSTLALCLAGLLSPSRGEIRIDGLPAGHDRRAVAARVGLLFQSPEGQVLTRRVADEVALPLENLGWPRADIGSRVALVLAGLGLAPLAARDPHTLSGGEMQRVALAAALAPEPRYLFLDEPRAHLDRQASVELEAWLTRQAIGERCLRLEIAPRPPRLANDRLLLLDDGRLVFEGKTLPAAWRERLGEPTGLTAPSAASSSSATAGDWRPTRPGTILRTLGLEIGAGGQSLARRIDLELFPGRVTMLTGPSGSGKSTLLMTLAGLIEPRGGTIECGATLRARVTYLPQFPERLFWRPSVWEELNSFTPVGACRGGGESTPEPGAAGIGGAWELRVVGLPDRLAGVSPFRLSGGERRRLALACALRCRRPVVLLDEPAAGLDGPGLRILHDLLRRITAAGGTALVVAHDPLVLGWGDRVLELRDGRLDRIEPAALAAESRQAPTRQAPTR